MQIYWIYINPVRIEIKGSWTKKKLKSAGISSFQKTKTKRGSQNCLLRIYPVGMARRLEEAYTESKHEILPDLRMKFALDLNFSDKELFERYPLKDLFMDGKLHECFFYMYRHCSLQIPDSWVDTMANFNRDLQLAVT